MSYLIMRLVFAQDVTSVHYRGFVFSMKCSVTGNDFIIAIIEFNWDAFDSLGWLSLF